MSATVPISAAEELAPEKARRVRHHLDEVAASHAFAGSKRAQEFLRLIVEHALAGELDSLRERMIGVEMFHRPVDYDTANDSVVRVKATEVRKKLAQYYLERNEPAEIHIEIPAGSYVPRFAFEPLEPASPPKPGQAFPPATESPAVGRWERPTERPDGGTGSAPRRLSVEPHSSSRLTLGLSLTLILVALACYGVFKGRGNAFPMQTPIRSVAILPFENASGDPQQDYFADGMTQELIAELGQVSSLHVISKTSAMSYKGTAKGLPEIARELAVEGIVDGSVLRQGNQVRLSARLVDARTGHPIWNRTYVRDRNDIPALEGQVAQAISDAASIQVSAQAQAQLARAHQVNAEAEDLYLRGMLRLNEGDRENAAGFFRQSIQADPDLAQAHAALANCYGWMGESGALAYEEAFLNQSREAAEAVALDDSLSEAHAELAYAAMNLNWDWATAAKEFRRALALNPSSASVYESYAGFLERTGDSTGAISEAERGRELDPVSLRALSDVGYAYYFSRRYDRAFSLLKRAQTQDENLHYDIFLLGNLYAEMGLYQKSIAEYLKLGDRPHALGHLGNAYARAGQVDAAHKVISELEKHVLRDGEGRYEIALVYAGLGAKNEAFNWLSLAYRTHDKGLTYIEIDPCLDPLRSDPRFAALEQRVGLAVNPTPR
jgi:TolB-like protein